MSKINFAAIVIYYMLYACNCIIPFPFKTTMFFIMLCLLQDTECMKREISDKTTKCIESGELLHPTVYRVPTRTPGTHIYYVSIDSLIYRFKTCLKAMDISFKLHYVLNLEYSHASKQAYLLLQHHFYEMPSKDDSLSPALSLLLTALKKHC